MINDTYEKFQELCDAVQTEAALREKIKEQAERMGKAGKASWEKNKATWAKATIEFQTNTNNLCVK